METPIVMTNAVISARPSRGTEGLPSVTSTGPPTKAAAHVVSENTLTARTADLKGPLYTSSKLPSSPLLDFVLLVLALEVADVLVLVAHDRIEVWKHATLFANSTVLFDNTEANLADLSAPGIERIVWEGEALESGQRSSRVRRPYM